MYPCVQGTRFVKSVNKSCCRAAGQWAGGPSPPGSCHVLACCICSPLWWGFVCLIFKEEFPPGEGSHLRGWDGEKQLGLGEGTCPLWPTGVSLLPVGWGVWTECQTGAGWLVDSPETGPTPPHPEAARCPRSPCAHPPSPALCLPRPQPLLFLFGALSTIGMRSTSSKALAPRPARPAEDAEVGKASQLSSGSGQRRVTAGGVLFFNLNKKNEKFCPFI